MTCNRRSEGISVHERLSTFLAEDSEDRLWYHIIRRLEDPLKPRSSSDHIRVNPIVLILGSVALVSVSVFIFFNYGLQ